MFITAFLAGLCCFHLASGATHSLQYFYSGSSEIPSFPEFVVVAMVDGNQFVHYDSDSKKAVPKQDWIAKNVDSQYWERETGNFLGASQAFKGNIEIVKQRFNQTGGVHILQEMYGCQWDDETGVTDGYRQYGYDGEDFFTFDLKNVVWVAVVPQAIPSKNKWDLDKAQNEYLKNYHEKQCIDWLKKYVQYGKNTLGRNVSPSVSLIRSGSGVVCHATGFYPEGVMITWKRDGQEMQEEVDVGETMPNEDQTFQKRVMLTVSSEQLESSQYTCEVAHKSGTFERRLKIEDLQRKVPGEESVPNSYVIVGAVIGVVVLVAGFIAGFVWWKKRQNPGFARANTDDGSASSDEIPRKV